ncbi:MAG TPA: hypothetical protein VIL14_00720, partial [Nitrososphaeraceae archaeon]
ADYQESQTGFDLGTLGHTQMDIVSCKAILLSVVDILQQILISVSVTTLANVTVMRYRKRLIFLYASTSA